MTHKKNLAIDLAIRAGLFVDARRGMQGCRAAARVAILEHRLYANGKRVTHTETRLPDGRHHMMLVELDFRNRHVDVRHKRAVVRT